MRFMIRQFTLYKYSSLVWHQYMLSVDSKLQHQTIEAPAFSWVEWKEIHFCLMSHKASGPDCSHGYVQTLWHDGQILTKVMRIRFNSEYVLLFDLLPPALCHGIKTEVESWFKASEQRSCQGRAAYRLYRFWEGNCERISLLHRVLLSCAMPSWHYKGM